jgi:hypothetical protein
MIIKKIFILVALLLTMQTTAYCWFWDKPDAVLLQEAMTSDDPAKVDRCLDRQIELRNYMGVLRLKQHAVQMTQKERGRISGTPGSTSADLARELEPWKKIIKKADTLTMKKSTFGQQAQSQQETP